MTALQPAPPPPAHRAPVGPERSRPLRLALLVAALALVWMLTSASVMVMIGALLVIITLHELGHYLTAKWSGMEVTEFFLGFGPRIWSFRRGETEYGLKAIPAGAYVKIIGMNNLEEVDPADEARTYRQQSYPKRMLVILAGSGMHFLICLVLIFTLLVGWGAPGGRLFGGPGPDPATWEVGTVLEGSAADQAGVQPGDRVLTVAGEPIATFGDLGTVVSPRAGDEVDVVVERGGEQLVLPTTIQEREEDDGTRRGLLGVTGTMPRERSNVVEAVPATVADFGELMTESVKAMGQLLSPSGISNFAGQVADGRQGGDASSGGEGATTSPEEEASRPMSVVGATRFGAQALQSGVDNFLFVLIVLNAFIGLFNLIPLLPLDGGHAAIATYERIREGRSGRRYFVDVTKLLPLTYAVVMGLVILGVSAAYLDVVNPPNIP
jgi:membrane-associated protease RseP (regulator of RpoE activity)